MAFVVKADRHVVVVAVVVVVVVVVVVAVVVVVVVDKVDGYGVMQLFCGVMVHRDLTTGQELKISIPEA